jgi:hypothetical protein
VRFSKKIAVIEFDNLSNVAIHQGFRRHQAKQTILQITFNYNSRFTCQWSREDISACTYDNCFPGTKPEASHVMEIKITVASKMAVIKTLSALIALSFLAGCESPEQQAKERAETMKKMAIQVTKHLLDRDPSTLSESTNFLRGQELTDDCIAKLSKLEVIPNAGLDVIKEKTIAEDEKRRNVVEVTSATAMVPIDKTSTPFKVAGKNIIKVEGKPDKVIPFSLTMTLKLTPEMQGYPRVTDVNGLTHEDIYGGPEPKPMKEAKGRKRRGH